MSDMRAIVRAAIPDATEELVEHVLWERTPFPVGKITAKSLYHAAARFRRAIEHKHRLCIFCDRFARADAWECEYCAKALAAAGAKEEIP